MSQRRKTQRARAGRPAFSTHPSPNTSAMLPLGAMLLASSFGALAQTAPATAEQLLPTVVVREKAMAPEGKDALQTTDTSIGKGKQLLRDIPQSVTVVTERLMDDRNLDTLKEALKNTAGITFQAAEGGEEDIRLRGFALQSTGDLFIDGMRDPAIYDRDTFNLDRMEVLRGSASMLFGRGSTGGAVNQVSKTPRLIDEHQVDLTVGTHHFVRATGDFNIKTGESSALRLNAMVNKADNNGSGSSIDKRGMGGRLPHRHRRAGRVPGHALPPGQPQRHQLRHALRRAQGRLQRPGAAAGRPRHPLRPRQRLQRFQRHHRRPRAHPPLQPRQRTQDTGAGRPVRPRPAFAAPSACAPARSTPPPAPSPTRSARARSPWTT